MTIEAQTKYKRRSYSELTHFGYSLRTRFNREDVFVGAEFGLSNQEKNWFAFVALDARPFQKRILVKDDGGTWYQFAEDRYLASLGGEWFRMINDSNVGTFIQLSGGYTWGNYAGAKRKPESGLTLSPTVGILFRIQSRSYIKVGYEHFLTGVSSISPSWIYFSLTYFF